MGTLTCDYRIHTLVHYYAIPKKNRRRQSPEIQTRERCAQQKFTCSKEHFLFLHSGSEKKKCFFGRFNSLSQFSSSEISDILNASPSSMFMDFYRGTHTSLTGFVVVRSHTCLESSIRYLPLNFNCLLLGHFQSDQNKRKKIDSTQHSSMQI